MKKNKRITFSKTRRFLILERDNFRCQYCGATPNNAQLTIDHIRPLSRGGDNTDNNLTTACEACNIGKNSRIIDREHGKYLIDLNRRQNKKHMLFQILEDEDIYSYINTGNYIEQTVINLKNNITILNNKLSKLYTLKRSFKNK